MSRDNKNRQNGRFDDSKNRGPAPPLFGRPFRRKRAKCHKFKHLPVGRREAADSIAAPERGLPAFTDSKRCRAHIHGRGAVASRKRGVRTQLIGQTQGQCTKACPALVSMSGRPVAVDAPPSPPPLPMRCDAGRPVAFRMKFFVLCVLGSVGAIENNGYVATYSGKSNLMGLKNRMFFDPTDAQISRLIAGFSIGFWAKYTEMSPGENKMILTLVSANKGNWMQPFAGLSGGFEFESAAHPIITD
eukprot:2601229-Prymnesium_polylepis.1